MLVVDVGVAPAAIEGGDGDVMAGELRGKLLDVVDIALDGGSAGVRRDLRRIADDGRDAVAALGGFLEQGAADEAGRADEGDLHGWSPCLVPSLCREGWIF